LQEKELRTSILSGSRLFLLLWFKVFQSDSRCFRVKKMGY